MGRGAFGEIAQLATVVSWPVGELRPGFSPRDPPIDEEQVLQLVHSTKELSPIVVHVDSARIVDGVHRWEAHRRLGREEIQGRCFTGTDADAILLSVTLRATSGKTLSDHERRRAARQLLAYFPDRSDRWIANTCDLSPTTVGRVRGEVETLHQHGTVARVGRDGRRRYVVLGGPLTPRRSGADFPDAPGHKRKAATSGAVDAQLIAVLEAAKAGPRSLGAFFDKIGPTELRTLAVESRRRSLMWDSLTETLEGALSRQKRQ